MAEKEEILIEITIDNKEAIANEKRLIQEIEQSRIELTKRRKELKESGGTNKQAAAEIGKLTRKIQEDSKELRLNQAAIKANDNSINGLRNSVNRLTRERNNLNVSTKEGKKQFDQLTKTIKAQTDELKGLEGAVGDNRRNVGNYTESIIEASDQLGIFGFNIGALKGGFSSFKNVLGSLTLGFKGLRGAILATGIGALILAITSLISFFTKTERGAQKLRVIIAGLQAAFGTFSDVAVALGEKLFKAFEDPQQAAKDFATTIKDFVLKQINLVTEGLTGLGKAISLVFEGEFAEAADTAAEAGKNLFLGLTPVVALLVDGAEAAKDFAKELQNDVTAAISLEKRLNTLKVAERELSVSRAEANRLIKEQRFIAEDTNEAIQDRINALEIATSKEQQFLEAEKRNQKERIAILEKQQSLNESSEEDLEELAEAKIKLYELETASFEAQTTIRNALRTLEAQKRKEELEQQEEDFDKSTEIADKQIEEFNRQVDERIKAQQREVDAARRAEAAKADAKTKANKTKELADKTNAENEELALGLFAENTIAFKIIASKRAIVNTFEGVSNALALKLPPPAPQIQAGLILAAGLANVAAINGIDVGGQAAGGGSFMTNGETYLKVGDNPSGKERVTVEPIGGRGITKINPSSGITQLAGGGTVTATGSQFSGSIDQTEVGLASLERTLMKQPAPVLDLKQFNRKQNNVTVQENRARR